MADISEYPLGTVITVFGEWDVDDVPTDPSTVTLTVQHPDGTEDVYTYPEAPITKTSDGRYEADFKPDSSGLWKYRWEGVGLADGAREGQFWITASFVGTDAYTYDPTTPVGEVRLLIDDRDLSHVNELNPRRRSAIFSDAEIGVFISKTGTTFGAAALALITIASNRALLVQKRQIGKTDVEYGPLRADLLKNAAALQEQEERLGVTTMAPADGYAEQAWDDFSTRDIIYRTHLRDA